MNSASAIEKINPFYVSKYETINKIGKKLNRIMEKKNKLDEASMITLRNNIVKLLDQYVDGKKTITNKDMRKIHTKIIKRKLRMSIKIFILRLKS